MTQSTAKTYSRLKVFLATTTTTLAGMLATTGAANAASITHTQTIEWRPTTVDKSFILPKFDEALGTLESVTIDLIGFVKGNARAESQEGAPSTVTLDLASEIALILSEPDITLVEVKPLVSEQVALSSYDGVLDFAGSSGVTLPERTASDSTTNTFMSGDSELSYFVGSGDQDLIFTALGTSTVTGAGNLLSGFQTDVAGEVTLTYEYESVPEPTSVIGLGLVGLVLLTQTKRNRKS
ncbi:MAG: choice-of-anchor E domain-containing protein [Moorea sp. SIOASIH]|uniref:choice-of-anchor E domain-containing protein n=1 Tax=Moorena sp. SIOASIH TaxID=2607817 RepID=UPI0013B8FD8B|nr:choice-of-anchor E domain-containing protein [Moorena sp. SIOASIH]NEO37793.1 choice-of-anchor E domain-containing protein [Moorena sp. SIOASIH]